VGLGTCSLSYQWTKRIESPVHPLKVVFKNHTGSPLCPPNLSPPVSSHRKDPASFFKLSAIPITLCWISFYSTIPPVKWRTSQHSRQKVRHQFVWRHRNIVPTVFPFQFVCFLTFTWVFEHSGVCRRALHLGLKNKKLLNYSCAEVVVE